MPSRSLTIAALAAQLLWLAAPATPAAAQQATGTRIDAIRYATIRDFPLSGLVMGAPRDERIDIAMVIWLIRTDDRVVLFDTGFHRERWREAFDIADFVPPDSAVRIADLDPRDVTDVIISHAHWDHMGGIDRFPNAMLHIQKDEYAYYTGEAWQEGGRNGGIDEADILELVRRNTVGQVNLVDGDDVEILPGIRAYTGARHTFASQYIRVDGPPAFVLASDNCYLYHNLEHRLPGATFLAEDREANVAALRRMIELAGSADRVVPGHDPLQFERFRGEGRVARIR